MTVLFPERDFDNRETAEYVLDDLVAPEEIDISGDMMLILHMLGKTLAEVAQTARI